ncbi:MAG: hypothetical protein V7K27_17910 [Nostoc sp.]
MSASIKFLSGLTQLAQATVRKSWRRLAISWGFRPTTTKVDHQIYDLVGV